jgi:cephalosporin hydroxylase
VSEVARFFAEVAANIQGLKEDTDVQALSRIWLREVTRHKYAYNFTWMGRPLIQFPQDMLAMQEIIWRVRPDLIIETGVAHGGSLIYYASLLELLGNDGRVIGIDIDIREHNRVELERHPMFKRLDLIQGSSIEPSVADQVTRLAEGRKSVLVILDSNHTHDHVLNELRLYAPLVTKGSYLVVFDTLIEDMPDEFFADRPWGKGNNPKTAVREFMTTTDRFAIDKDIDAKLLITVALDGYLRCVKD